MSVAAMAQTLPTVKVATTPIDVGAEVLYGIDVQLSPHSPDELCERTAKRGSVFRRGRCDEPSMSPPPD